MHYSVNGLTTVKSANGTAPMTGVVDLTISPDGSVHAVVNLAPATGNFLILGFLPVVAVLDFDQFELANGALDQGVGSLNLSTLMLVKIPAVSLFGIPIGGGAGCQTTAPSSIGLRSGLGGFHVATGGTLTGSYSLSGLNSHCGILGGIISAFTAGSGNTLSLKLTPKG